MSQLEASPPLELDLGTVEDLTFEGAGGDLVQMFVLLPPGYTNMQSLKRIREAKVTGKIKTIAQRGEPMPEGWMVGRDGQPLTDPQRRADGFLLGADRFTDLDADET